MTENSFQSEANVLHLRFMHLWRGLFLLLVAASCARAQEFEFGGAATPTFGRQRAVRARLHLSHETAKPGDTVMAGIELKMNAGWHTYWRNPGDSGEPTKIYWALTNGITAGEIQWPVPEKFITPDALKLIVYVYHDRAVLLVPLQVPTSAKPGDAELSALVWWLECSDKLCVPGSNLVQSTLTIGTQSKLSEETNFFAEAQRHLPKNELPGTAMVKWDGASDAKTRPLTIQWNTATTEPDFFPDVNPTMAISNQTEVIPAADGISLRKLASKKNGKWGDEISGLLVRKEKDSLAGYEAVLKFAGKESSSNAPSISTESKSIWGWLVYAFIGGLILNVMPCVLPVIALKILGFVSQSREHPKRVRTLGLLYTLGVIASFLVLAGIVIGVKAAGQKAGWGMQFSNPKFIVVLTVIVTLVALNLFGVFEVTLSGRAMGAAGEAASRHGGAGAFMNGVLATVLATPCTAPFLGAALGFAFAQPSHIIVLFFIIVALGLAAPYLVLSWNPKWLKFLPKPGVWMERFKIAMGFPMLATAVWLFSLTTTFYGERSWWLGVFLVFVGGAAWTFGTFVQRSQRRRTLAIVVIVALLATGYTWALDNELRWRSPDLGGTGNAALAHAPEDYPWQTWSSEAVAKARADGKPVIVDFTAKWCLTCNVSVKPAFENKAVIQKLKAMGAAALVADYTLYPPVISQELERFGRSGVPLVLVYPADPGKPPLVLPEPLPYPAPYAPTILEALDKIAVNPTASAK
jgi:thiol:disulfide interchange protein DsbD